MVGAGYFIHLLIPEIPLAASLLLPRRRAIATGRSSGLGDHPGRLPKRLMHLLEGGADELCLWPKVAFSGAIAAAMTGVCSLVDASLNFPPGRGWQPGHRGVPQLVAGPIPRLDDLPWLGHLSTHVVLMLLLPFASPTWWREHLGVSGILSAVAAGMMR